MNDRKKHDKGKGRLSAGKEKKGKERLSAEKEIKGKEGFSAEKVVWKPGNMLYPLPAVMVSCQRPKEKPNIITIAWAGTVCSSPAMVSISVRKERYSYEIIRETGEFVVNLVTEKLAFAADWCGVKSGREVDKFKELHLTEQKMEHLSSPGIAESPVNLECRVQQIIPLGSHDMFIAEVVGVMVDGACLDKQGKFHLNAAGLVAYSHGEYFTLGKKLGKFGYSVKKTPADRTGKFPGAKNVRSHISLCRETYTEWRKK